MGHISAKISLNGEDADVRIGDRSFKVAASEKKGRSDSCPTELVIAALGS